MWISIWVVVLSLQQALFPLDYGRTRALATHVIVDLCIVANFVLKQSKPKIDLSVSIICP